MELSALSGVDLMSAYQTPKVSSALADDSDSLVVHSAKDDTPFDSIFQSALNLIDETNAYSNAAEEEEIKYALGETNSIHDVQIAQQKANVSLQYTVAVRDAVVEAYKEIMNLQF
ncbi:MAG: flagellar hook-basal body complex protein FliE [Lachnospiraceae bacterium]|nr:flagellar hook-basal body complex protein FliE [Lachnospiraceae bacterium]